MSFAHPAILELGNPVLRSVASPVSSFDSELAKLAGHMQMVMEEAQGVGLAAPQVGHLKRVVIIPTEHGFRALVNPAVAESGQERSTELESCLSLPGLSLPVERSSAVVLTGQDLGGRPEQIELQGFNARVAQHEVDHLNGLLIIDRVPPRLRYEAVLQLINQKK